MNRKSCFGCGCLVLLIIGAIAIGIFVVAPRVMEKGAVFAGEMIESSKHRAAVESTWQPPSERPDASWFPAAVEKGTLRTSADISTVPELQLDRPGRRGTYRGEKQDIEVIVIPVSDLEREGILDKAASTLADESRHVIKGNTANSSFRISTNTSRVTMRTPGRLYVRLNGDDHTRLWWIKDWLFIFRTTGPEDPDAFAEKYLEAMQPAELEKR